MMAATFMGIDVPKDWDIAMDPVSGTFDLTEGSFRVSGRSATEVRNRLICHHKMMKESNEQHRSADQTTRNPPAAQHPAGNAGRAPPSSGALAGQGTLAKLYAQQGAGSLNPFMQQQLAAQQNALSRAMMYGGVFGNDLAASSPKPLPRVSPSVGELIGHRAWTVQGRNLLLSVSAKSAWFPSQAMHDKTGHGQEIDDHNTAGIWAFKDPYELSSEFYSLLQSGGVFGTVWLWGTVIEHERGYRAQYAAIRSLERAAPGIDIEILRVAYVPHTSAMRPEGK